MHHAATWQRKEEERCWDGYTGELGTTSKLRQSSVWPGRGGAGERDRVRDMATHKSVARRKAVESVTPTMPEPDKP